MEHEYKDFLEIRKILIEWERFYRDPNTEFWDKENFLRLLDNEQYILAYSFEPFDGKIRVFESGEGAKERKRKLLNRLREIYNERFKDIEPEVHTKYTKPEIYYLLKQIGFIDIDKYNHLSEKNKVKILSKILDCAPDTAKKIKNGNDYRYSVNEQSKKKIDTFLDSLFNAK
jgi:hypothetical protein